MIAKKLTVGDTFACPKSGQTDKVTKVHKNGKYYNVTTASHVHLFWGDLELDTKLELV